MSRSTSDVSASPPIAPSASTSSDSAARSPRRAASAGERLGRPGRSGCRGGGWRGTTTAPPTRPRPATSQPSADGRATRRRARRARRPVRPATRFPASGLAGTRDHRLPDDGRAAVRGDDSPARPRGRPDRWRAGRGSIGAAAGSVASRNHERRPPVAGTGPRPLRRLVEAMPKAELHLHLDGSLRVDTALELARTRGVDAPRDLRPGCTARSWRPSGRPRQAELLRAFDLPIALHAGRRGARADRRPSSSRPRPPTASATSRSAGARRSTSGAACRSPTGSPRCAAARPRPPRGPASWSG